MPGILLNYLHVVILQKELRKHQKGNLENKLDAYRQMDKKIAEAWLNGTFSGSMFCF